MAELASTADGDWAAPVAARPPELARQDAVWHLYDRRYADMVRFAAFLTGDVHTAQDVAHDAFVRLLDAWDRIADPGRADAYLKATIVNLVRGEHRRREAAARRSSPHLALVASAEDDALGRAGRQSVLDAVSALPIRQRACVVMRYWMRMSETEIATTLDLSVGSVRTHVMRPPEPTTTTSTTTTTPPPPPPTTVKPVEQPAPTEPKPEPTQPAPVAFQSNLGFADLAASPMKQVFTGTGTPGSVVRAESAYGSAEAAVGSKGNWELKLRMYEVPVGMTVAVRVTNNASDAVFEYTLVKQPPPAPPEIDFTANAAFDHTDAAVPYDEYWGKSTAGATITISSPYGGGQVTSNGEGKWGARIEFPGAPIGETFTVTITSSKGSAVYNFSLVSTRTA